jgi:hypothetical protein
MKLFFKDKHIKFYGEKEHIESMDVPSPALNHVPEWFKKTQSHLSQNVWSTYDDNGTITGSTTATVKKCVPFLDAMTTGYIIPAPFDAHFNLVEGNDGPNFFMSWSYSDYDYIQDHNKLQLGNHPATEEKIPGGKVWKLMNPWHIETPPGYSCLFVNPLNHIPTQMNFFSGVVDTDNYNDRVNFPFLWTGKSGETVIKKGTPLIQVIPFKRDSWSSDVVKLDDEKSSKFTAQANKIKSLLVDGYRKYFWTKKKFK